MRPPHRHTTRRSTTGHTMRSSRTALHPRCRHEPRGCDLNSVNETEITPHEAVFDGEGNRLLPTTGQGEGVRPRTPVRGRTPQWKTHGKSTLWSCQRTLLRPCRPLLLDPLSIDEYRPEMAWSQRLFGPRNQFVTFGVCYSYAFGSSAPRVAATAPGMTPPLSSYERQGWCS